MADIDSLAFFGLTEQMVVTEEDESSTGHVWVAGFHRVVARSHLEHVLELMNGLFL
jgi:hypothetical protein